MALKISVKCRKHPRYNPEKDGEAGIKGGCAKCYALFHLYADYIRYIDAEILQ